jgi:hypothetical protein
LLTTEICLSAFAQRIRGFLIVSAGREPTLSETALSHALESRWLLVACVDLDQAARRRENTNASALCAWMKSTRIEAEKSHSHH